MSLVNSFLDQVLSRLESDVKFLTDHGFISKTDYETVLGVFSRVNSEKTSPSKKKKHAERKSAACAVLSPEAEPERIPPPPDTNNLGSGDDGIVELNTLNKSPSSTSLSKSSSNESLNQLSPDESSNVAPATTLNKSTSIPLLKKHPHIPPPNPRATFPIPSIDAGKRPLPPPRPVPVGPQCKAIWDFEGQSDGDLPFKEGDIIQIVNEDDADWWLGRLNGKEGLIPSNRVEKMFTPSPRRVHAPPPFPIPRIPRSELDVRR